MEMDSMPNGNGNSTAVIEDVKAAARTASISSQSRMTYSADSLKLENQLLRVPFEHLKKSIRTNYRIAGNEMGSVFSTVDVISNDEAADRITKDQTVDRLNSLVSRLQGLKRKLEEGSQTEEVQVQRCRARLDHLQVFQTENPPPDWNNTREKRFLVDYMLRMSYYETAVKLAENSKIQDLVDIDVFQEAKRIIDALQDKDVAPALAWCAENKSRLKKSKSKFEFQLRLQEFIELVRAENNLQAIRYAQKYLAPWGATHMKELQRVMATLAFKSQTECATYKVLFEAKQWDYLLEHFKQEFCRLYGMTVEPLLNIYLQAGLSSLKTPSVITKTAPKKIHSRRKLPKLACPLPFSKQHHSKLVCYITKESMDTENPPLVLPNGYVYSTKALEEMARQNNGKVTCPRTLFVCNYSELAKAYIS